MIQQGIETKENRVARHVLEALTLHDIPYNNLKTFFERNHPEVKDLRRLYDMKQVLKATSIIGEEGTCYQACLPQSVLLGSVVLSHVNAAKHDLGGGMLSLRKHYIPENSKLGRKAGGQLPALAVIAKLVMLVLLAHHPAAATAARSMRGGHYSEMQPSPQAAQSAGEGGILTSTFIKLIHAAFSDDEEDEEEEAEQDKKTKKTVAKNNKSNQNSSRARNQRQVYLVLNLLVLLKILVGPDAACKRSTQAYTLAPPLYHATGRYYFGNVLNPGLASVVDLHRPHQIPQRKKPQPTPQQPTTAGKRKRSSPGQHGTEGAGRGRKNNGCWGRRPLTRSRCAPIGTLPPPPVNMTALAGVGGILDTALLFGGPPAVTTTTTAVTTTTGGSSGAATTTTSSSSSSNTAAGLYSGDGEAGVMGTGGIGGTGEGAGESAMLVAKHTTAKPAPLIITASTPLPSSVPVHTTASTPTLIPECSTPTTTAVEFGREAEEEEATTIPADVAAAAPASGTVSSTSCVGGAPLLAETRTYDEMDMMMMPLSFLVDTVLDPLPLHPPLPPCGDKPQFKEEDPLDLMFWFPRDEYEV